MKTLASFAVGPLTPMLRLVQPGFEMYAALHGYECKIIEQAELAGELASLPHQVGWRPPYCRPASWYKLPLFASIFQDARVESILWLDADVLILDPSRDIEGDVAGSAQGLVFHEQEGGVIANCGVWFLRRAMLPLLEQLWDRADLVDHPWWEQGAMIAAMGGPQSVGFIHYPDASNTLLCATARLNHQWNWTFFDNLRSPAPYFAHATGHHNRTALLQRWLWRLADRLDPLDEW